MTQQKNISQLKAIAKERSLGKYGTLIGATIVLGIIRFMVVSITSSFTAGADGILPFILGLLIMLVVNTLLGVFTSGEAYMYMNLIYSQTVSISDIFFGFKQQPQKAVALQGVFEVISGVLMLPYFLFVSGLFGAPTVETSLIMSIISLVACILIIYVKICLSQTFYLLHDFPDWSLQQILTTGLHMMKGKKLRYLGLALSFIPLILLGCITLFIPLLWVNVYMFAAQAAFYQDLMACASAQKEEGENGLN